MRVLVRPTRLAAAVAAATVVAISGAVLALPAAPATASTGADPATKAAAPPSTAMLQLVVYDGEDETGTELREAVLICNPDLGSHPSAKVACDALRAIDGDLNKLTPRKGICIKVQQPVTAVVDGWYGSPIHFKKTYGNDCALKNALAPVFDF